MKHSCVEIQAMLQEEEMKTTSLQKFMIVEHMEHCKHCRIANKDRYKILNSLPIENTKEVIHYRITSILFEIIVCAVIIVIMQILRMNEVILPLQIILLIIAGYIMDMFFTSKIRFMLLMVVVAVVINITLNYFIESESPFIFGSWYQGVLFGLVYLIGCAIGVSIHSVIEKVRHH